MARILAASSAVGVPRRVVRAARADDGVVGSEAVVIHRRHDADRVVVRAERDVLAAERGIGAVEDAPPRWSAGRLDPADATSPWSVGPASPGLSASSGLPNSFSTDAVGTKSIRGWVTPGRRLVKLLP